MSFIIDEKGRKKFDTRVTILDPKTGKVVKHQPYRFMSDQNANPQQWFERDGVRYHVNGELIDKPKASQKASGKSVEEGLI